MTNDPTRSLIYRTSSNMLNQDSFLTISPSNVFRSFCEYLELQKGLDSTDLEHIIRCTNETLALSLPPDNSGNASRTNILVGNVQSGKTTLIEGLIALSADTKIPLVAVLTGTKRNLTRQTITELVDLAAYLPSGSLKIIPDLSSLTPAEAQRLLDYHRSKTELIRTQFSTTLVIPIIKNAERINRLCDFLAQLDTQGLPGFVVIDDEADEFSLDTNVRNNAVPASACYRACIRLRQLLPVATTYIQVTATPQGPLLIDSTDPLSPDYVAISDNGAAYCGGSEYFLEPQSDYLIRHIPPGERPQVWVASPTTRNRIPTSLRDAFHFFLAAGGIALADKVLPSVSMMIHPAREVNYHQHYHTYLMRMLRSYFQALDDNYTTACSDLQLALQPYYDDIKRQYTPKSSDSDILRESIRIILQNSVMIINGDSDFRNTVWSTYWNTEPAHFILGAQCIARGFVVKNLIITYLARSNQPRGHNAILGQIDTIQQQARFFGYKRHYLPLCRVYMAREIANQFRIYALHEQIYRRTLKSKYRVYKPYQGMQLPIATRFAPTRRNILRSNPLISNLDQWFKEGYPYMVDLDEHKQRVLSLSGLLQKAFPDNELPEPGTFRPSGIQPTSSIPASTRSTIRDLEEFLERYTFSSLDRGISPILEFIRYMKAANPIRFADQSPVTLYLFPERRAQYEWRAGSCSASLGSFYRSAQSMQTHAQLLQNRSFIRNRFNDLVTISGYSQSHKFAINPHGGQSTDRNENYYEPTTISVQIHFFEIPTISTLIPSLLGLNQITDTTLPQRLNTWYSTDGDMISTQSGFDNLDVPYSIDRSGRVLAIYPLVCLRLPASFNVLGV